MKNKYPRGVEVVGGAIIMDEEGRILLVRSKNWSNKWTIPGGHIEPGEKVSEGITREVEEETGLKVKFVEIVTWGELIGSKDYHRPAHFLYFDLYYKLISKKVKLDGIELQDYKWLTIKEALKMDLAESFNKTIKDFIKYLENKK